MIRIALALVIGCMALPAESLPASLNFLEGTWDAKTTKGAAGASVSGAYVFRKELNGHVLARHSESSGCQGPVDFNCEHKDLLYIFAEGSAAKALYIDSEGHVIHYAVTTPTPNTAIFQSDSNAKGPQFRLVYELKGASMEGKFQLLMPGKTEWTSYLEWQGAKKQ